jgi:hypothetical protein
VNACQDLATLQITVSSVPVTVVERRRWHCSGSLKLHFITRRRCDGVLRSLYRDAIHIPNHILRIIECFVTNFLAKTLLFSKRVLAANC